MNALTIDVEDYHNVLARDWLGREFAPTQAVVNNTQRWLALLATHNVHATFFVLGEVAESYPALLREIAAAGHELGVHGYYHRQVFKLSPEQFRREVADAKARIEDAAGVAAEGHRAPAFSIRPDTAWALDVLANLGFRYDSSIFPIAGRRYGWPGFPLDIHEMTLADGRRLIEAPLSAVELFGRRWPSCGGGYLRLFPAAMTRWAMRWVTARRPAIVYLHPYEIELDGPPLDTSGLDDEAAEHVRRFHRMQLRRRQTVEPKVVSLLRTFEFAPLGRVIDHVLGGAPAPAATAH